MRNRLRIGFLSAGVLALLGAPIQPEQATAQSTERFKVMVTNLKPLDDANKRFGRDLAKELRNLINQLPTHQPMDEDDVKDAAKQYDIEYDELDCIQSLQIANLLGAQIVVFCGTVTENRDERTFSLVGVQFAAPGGGGSFQIEDATWDRDDAKVAAAEIAESFNTYVTQSRHALFCGEDYDGKNWTGAEENCTAALEMNPGNTQVRFIYANVLHGQEKFEEAYAETTRVMEEDPLHEAAIQLAGYLAATLGRADEAREHYSNYLTLNPGNASVRMQVAYDLAQAGDAEGAMLLAEEGLELEPDNVDLLLQHASFATRAAQDLEAAAEPGAPLSMEAAEFYQKAQSSYRTAYDERGLDMEQGHLRNMVATYSKLGQIDEAVAMMDRVLETHADDATLWSDNANLLKQAGRVDDALSALGETLARDPDFANVRVRQAQWRVDAEREDESLPYWQSAVEHGEISADLAARSLFAAGYNRGINPKPPNWPFAQRMIDLANTFADELSEEQGGQIDFWHAFVIYNVAMQEQEPSTLETARRTLPKFQQAARLFALPRVGGYAQSVPSIDLQQFRDATQQYIEIQEALIQRGR